MLKPNGINWKTFCSNFWGLRGYFQYIDWTILIINDALSSPSSSRHHLFVKTLINVDFILLTANYWGYLYFRLITQNGLRQSARSGLSVARRGHPSPPTPFSHGPDGTLKVVFFHCSSPYVFPSLCSFAFICLRQRCSVHHHFLLIRSLRLICHSVADLQSTNDHIDALLICLCFLPASHLV